MKKLNRHQVNIDVIKRNIESRARILDSNLRVARSNPDKLDLDVLLSNAQDYLGYLSVIEPESIEICRTLRIMVQAGTAIFAVATVTKGEAEVNLDDEPLIRLVAKDLTDYSSVRNWLIGFFSAMIYRDDASLDKLSSIPIDILRSSSSKSDDCLYLFVDALQAFRKREQNIIARLLVALRATDPDQLSIATEYVLNIVVPEMELLYRLLLQDAAGFNEALVTALEHHKKYWSKGDRKLDPDGYLALGPLAIASFAYDINIHIELESDYLLMRLLRGDCRLQENYR